jgi:hypothetical protein
MPDPRDWLRRHLQTMRAADRQVLQAIEQARRDINKMLREVESRPGIGAAVRQEQLLLVKRNLMREQSKLWRRLGEVVRARRLEAAANAIQLSQTIDAVLLRSVGGLRNGAKLAQAIADSERDAAERHMDRLIARVNGDSYVPLSQRVYNSEVNINGTINRKINSFLSRGLSAREAAMELRQYINPNTPGGIRYAAMRLSRTEINNAAHAVTIDAQRGKPWVEGMQWRLSSSHPKPDICDQYAHGGSRGDGRYSVGSTPSKPHPHCFCFVTPTTVSEKEFMDSLLGGRYDDYLSRYNNLSSGQVVTTKLG